MTLTPLDIQNKEFGRAWRGYDQEEVDSFLNQVLRAFEVIYRENQELRTKVQDYGERLQQYKQIEDTLNHTLVLAQKTADDLQRSAEAGAQVIRQEAEAQAREIVKAAEDQAVGAQNRYLGLEQQAEVFRCRLRAFLEAELRLLDQGGNSTVFNDVLAE